MQQSSGDIISCCEKWKAGDRSTKILIKMYDHSIHLVKDIMTYNYNLNVEEYEDFCHEVATEEVLNLQNNIINIPKHARNYFLSVVNRKLKTENRSIVRKFIEIPELHKVEDAIIRTEIEDVYNLIPENQIPLFYIYCADDKDSALEVLEDESQVIFKICKKKIYEILNFSIDNHVKNTKFESLTNFLGISKLASFDAKIPLLPILIGEKNFSKLLYGMAGKTLTFPTKFELNSLARKMDKFNESFKNEKVRVSDIKDFVQIYPEDFKLKLEDPDYKLEEVSQSLLMAYFQSVFILQNKITEMITGDDITDETKIKAYKLVQKDLRVQEKLLIALKGIIKN